jgi:hypothetical protein
MKTKIVPVAEMFVGWIRETTGKNDGPWVEAIQRTTGNKRGDPWCASFVNFVLDIAYKDQNPLPATASCDMLLAHAQRHNLLTTTPVPGDVFLVMRDGSKTDAVHTGIVTDVLPTHVKTIEGNTNREGAREGNGVWARERRRDGLLFIRVPAT